MAWEPVGDGEGATGEGEGAGVGVSIPADPLVSALDFPRMGAGCRSGLGASGGWR